MNTDVKCKRHPCVQITLAASQLVSVQVFLDCVEQFNLMVNSKGVVVHSELKGALQMKAYLSGMPECKLGLNDKTMFARQVRLLPSRPRRV